MEILTKKELANAIKTNTYIEYNKSQYNEMPKPTYEELYLKVNAIEEIQEELGIPLEVLFKALKNGIYYDHEHRNPENISFRFCCNDLIVEYTCFGYTDYDYLEIKDYGKTWALTREELENAKD